MLFRELLPNLVAPIIVYTTLLIPTNILFEAALSISGSAYGIPDLGGNVSNAVTNQYLQIDPEYFLVPAWPSLSR